MYCHRCKHSKHVAAGKFAERPYRKTPCARCRLVDYSNHVVEFDDSRATPHPVDQPEEELMPVSALSEVVLALMTLRPKLRDVVCLRFMGLKYEEIAKRLKTSRFVVQVRHARAIERWPTLEAVFAKKAAKKLRRKPKRHGKSSPDRAPSAHHITTGDPPREPLPTAING